MVTLVSSERMRLSCQMIRAQVNSKATIPSRHGLLVTETKVGTLSCTLELSKMKDSKEKKEATLIARIPKTLKQRLEVRAKDMGIKISELTRLACEKFLK